MQHAHQKPVQQVTYSVQETTTTTDDSETALLVPYNDSLCNYIYIIIQVCIIFQSHTPPPVYTHPEPVVSHPVQETTTTTADSEKALLV